MFDSFNESLIATGKEWRDVMSVDLQPSSLLAEHMQIERQESQLLGQRLPLMSPLPAGLAPTPFALTLRLRFPQPIARGGLAAIATGLGALGLQRLDALFEARDLLAQ